MNVHIVQNIQLHSAISKSDKWLDENQLKSCILNYYSSSFVIRL